MARRSVPPPPSPTRFGPNTALIAAHFAGLGQLNSSAVRALVTAQAQSDPLKFFLAWDQVANDSAHYDRIAFQNLVGTGYGVADQRLRALGLELSTAQAHQFAHAVIGRALALFGYPDLPADQLTVLSRAWTTVRG